MLLIFASSAILAKTYQQQKPVYSNISIHPVNELHTVKGLSAFTDKIIQACNKRDTVYLLSIVDEDVVVSHGGGIYGKDAFRNEFLRDFNGFEKLKRAIVLGGTIEKDEENPESDIYLYPYLQSAKVYAGKADTIEIDPYLTAVGITNSVSIHSQPSEKSKVKATLAYPLLKLDPANNLTQGTWYKIFTFDSKLSGYVKINQLYHLADITVTIQKKGDSFSIVSVAPYD